MGRVHWKFMIKKLPEFTGNSLLILSLNRKVIRDRLVIWGLKRLLLGIILGAILRDFGP